MINSFMTIGEQILIVFLMMLIGYVCGKQGMIDNRLADGLLFRSLFSPSAIKIGKGRARCDLRRLSPIVR